MKLSPKSYLPYSFYAIVFFCGFCLLGEKPFKKLMHSFSCYTRMPHEPVNHGNNNIHALEGSITPYNNMSKSFASEKWSNVPKKHYVEEAKSYTQPGSVAEKKAFFDAYYKKIAAQKAAAAALLEQEKAAAASTAANDHQVTTKVVDLAVDNNIANANISNNVDSLNIINLEDHARVSVPLTRPSLKLKPKVDMVVKQPIIKKKSAVSSWVASNHHRKDNINTPRNKNVVTSDHIDERRLAPKSLNVLMSSSFVKESCRKTQITKPATSSVYLSPKRGVTPLKTPAKAFVNEVNKQPLTTISSNKRIETPVHPPVVGSKSTGPKWRILSSASKSLTTYKSKLESPTISSPFLLRTEDRAARRKQKLEEKFNEKKAQVVPQKAQFKEKSGSGFRKMHESVYFKAIPLPDFYKGRETSEKKIHEVNPKPFTSRIKTSSSTYSVKTTSSRRLWKNNNQNQVF